MSDGENVGAETFTADVAVIGAGPLGIVTALELADAGLSVLLVESGSGDRREQDLARSATQDPFHVDKPLAVHRGLGGTSTLWGGRCVPYDPVDFERRPVLEEQLWPISYADVAAYHARASDWCVCGEAAFNAKQVPELAGAQLVPGFQDGAVRATDLERWSLPTRFDREYGGRLRNHPRIRLLLGWTCTEVLLDERDLTSVASLNVGTVDGKRGTVVAQRYVLAMGGLEVTRLLLASNRQVSAGLGNAGGHLGRWYMAHVEARIAEVHLHTDPDQTSYAYERDRDGVYVRRRFTFSADAQRAKRLHNGATWLVNPMMADERHGSGVLSGAYLTLISPLGRFLLAEGIRQFGTKAVRPTSVRAHLKNVVRDLGPALRFAFSFGYARYLRRGRKAPGFFVKSATNVYPLHYHGEQLPHWESRVELSDECDALGVPKLDLNLHYSDDDIASVGRAMDVLDRELRLQGVGELEYLHDDPEQAVRDYLLDRAGLHQLGTTRMSAGAEDGVVTPDLEVHGVRGLFVASTSVFPTSSQANPTFMGVALACRLADHLVESFENR